MVYMCNNVLPVLSDIVVPGSESKKDEEEKSKPVLEYDIKLEVLRQLADMSTFTLELGSDDGLKNVFSNLVVGFSE